MSASVAVIDGNFSGFWRRFAALLVDGIVMWLISVVVMAVFGVAMALLQSGAGNPSGPAMAVGVASVVLTLLGPLVYFVVMESGERGATFGKRALGIRVVDVNGERISKMRAFGRYLAHFFSNILLLIGYLMQPFTDRKQALHDMISGTVVVRTDKDSGSGIVVVVIALFFLMFVGMGILAAIAIPAYQDYILKAQVIQAEQAGKAATKAVETFYTEQHRYPYTLDETRVAMPKLTFVSDIEVNSGTGDVSIVFSQPYRKGPRILSFKPTRYVDGSFEWHCSGAGFSPNQLPRECR